MIEIANISEPETVQSVSIEEDCGVSPTRDADAQDAARLAVESAVSGFSLRTLREMSYLDAIGLWASDRSVL